jgi:hypothetical protein
MPRRPTARGPTRPCEADVALPKHRVVKVGETLYPHEQEGIEFAISELPDTDPYHL